MAFLCLDFGEATETSDIDIVAILDELSVEDIQTYNSILDTLPHRELICGFLSEKKEVFVFTVLLENCRTAPSLLTRLFHGITGAGMPEER